MYGLHVPNHFNNEKNSKSLKQKSDKKLKNFLYAILEVKHHKNKIFVV